MGTLAKLPGAIWERESPVSMLGKFMLEQLIPSVPGFVVGAGVGAAVARPVISRLITNELVKRGVMTGVAGAAGNGMAVVTGALGPNYQEGLKKYDGNEQLASEYAVTKTLAEVPANVVAGAFLGLKVPKSELLNILAQATAQGAGGAIGAGRASEAVGEPVSPGEQAAEFAAEFLGVPIEVAMMGRGGGQAKPPSGTPKPSEPPPAETPPGQTFTPTGELIEDVTGFELASRGTPKEEAERIHERRGEVKSALESAQTEGVLRRDQFDPYGNPLADTPARAQDAAGTTYTDPAQLAETRVQEREDVRIRTLAERAELGLRSRKVRDQRIQRDVAADPTRSLEEIEAAYAQADAVKQKQLDQLWRDSQEPRALLDAALEARLAEATGAVDAAGQPSAMRLALEAANRKLEQRRAQREARTIEKLVVGESPAYTPAQLSHARRAVMAARLNPVRTMEVLLDPNINRAGEAQAFAEIINGKQPAVLAGGSGDVAATGQLDQSAVGATEQPAASSAAQAAPAVAEQPAANVAPPAVDLRGADVPGVPAGMDLSKIEVKIPVVNRKTKRMLRAPEKADVALKEVDDKLRVAKGLLECLGT